MKRIILPASVFSFVLGVCWIGGMEFERGPDLAFTVIVAIVFAVMSIGIENFL